MTRRLFNLILCVSYFILPASAQTGAEVVHNINAIKRDTTYLYAEATTNNLDSARCNAMAILEVKVDEWVRKQYPKDSIHACIAKAKEHTFELHTLRSNLQRAFVYVRKGDILPIADRSEIVVFEVSKDSQELQATPTANFSEEVPVTPTQSTPTIVLTTEEQQMLTLQNLSDLNRYVKQLREQKRLSDYGKFATMPKDADCHIFICDTQGVVIARFRHQQDGKIYNLNTLKTDSVENYGRGAIWFQMKE